MENKHYINPIETIDKLINKKEYKEDYQKTTSEKSSSGFGDIFDRQVNEYFEEKERLENQKKELQDQKAYIELLQNKYILYHNIKNDNDEITKSK